jgi:DNA-binding FadR family transcriptional regulator
VRKDRDEAVAALKAFIAAGDYGAGDRLPSERDLIGSLKMTRTTLRKALDTLERDGVLWRHVGKGTFMSEDDPNDRSVAGSNGKLSEIRHQVTPVKMMRARLCIEPALAREAAVNASAEAIARMKLAQRQARAAQTWRDYEGHDDQFHRALAEGADNIVLLALFDELNQLRRAVALNIVVRGTEKPPETHRSFEQHDDIIAAIEAHDPSAAHDSMRAHIRSVAARLFEDN